MMLQCARHTINLKERFRIIGLPGRSVFQCSVYQQHCETEQFNPYFVTATNLYVYCKKSITEHTADAEKGNIPYFLKT